MLITLIKYLAMILCSFYIYKKLLHINTTKKVYFSFILFLSLILPVIYLLRTYAAPISIFIMVALFSVFVKYVFKTSLNMSLTVSSISFGIAYSVFVVAAAFMLPIGYFISILFHKYPSNLVSILCIGIIQFLITTLPFKMKRLRNGMPFLSEHGSSDIGVYISISLLIAASFFGMSKKAELIFLIPIFFAIICGLALLFWWRNRLTQRYIENVKAKEIKELQDIIDENKKQMEQIKYHNDELSKIIHKDNKLIPAMEFAVKEYLLSAEQEMDHKIHIKKANELLEQLEVLSRERSGILNNYDTKSKILPSTKVPSVDTLLSYMYQKAKEFEIDFDLSILGSVIYLVENIISELDIRTLLADLIDNAIIATKKSATKNIMINIGISGNYYSIDILDSGEPFTIEALLNFGINQITTHTNDGGSGIGIMTTFAIIKKYQASFVIEEYSDNNNFTKKVSICFDNQGQFRIKTLRADIKKLLSYRSDIIFINDMDA